MLEGETLVSGIQRGTLWHDGLYNVAKRSVYIRNVPIFFPGFYPGLLIVCLMSAKCLFRLKYLLIVCLESAYCLQTLLSGDYQRVGW